MRMTKKIFDRLVQKYEEEFDLNPLKKSRQRNFLIPRQVLFYVLSTKFHLHFQTLSDWTGWERTVCYNSMRRVQDGIDIRDGAYVDEINKWALVFEAMTGYINVTSKLVEDKSVSAEASIIKFLEEFDKTTSLDILYNVVNTIRNDR